MVASSSARASQPVAVPDAAAAAPPVAPGRTVDDQPLADLSRAPMPSESTLRWRRGLVRQTLRFVAFNARILRMVVRGHRASH